MDSEVVLRSTIALGTWDQYVKRGAGRYGNALLQENETVALSDTHPHHHHHQYTAPRRASIALIGFLLIGGYYLVTEHRAHLLGIIPFLFLPLGLVMHRFMHGHGGTRTASDAAPSEAGIWPPSEGNPR